MEREHWQFLMMMGAVIGLMLCFSLSTMPRSRLYRWTRRIFWSAFFLWGMDAFGLLGLNGVNLLAVCSLGVPGAAALMVLALL